MVSWRIVADDATHVSTQQDREVLANLQRTRVDPRDDLNWIFAFHWPDCDHQFLGYIAERFNFCPKIITPLYWWIDPTGWGYNQLAASRVSERNFSRGYEDWCRAPEIRRVAKKKKVFTQIWSHFLPKIRWRAKRKKKKRSSLKFGPIFCPKLGEEQKKRSSLKKRSHLLHKKGKKVFSKSKRGKKSLTRRPKLFRAPWARVRCTPWTPLS